MKQILYYIAIRSIPIILQIASPFHKRARLMTKGRRYWKMELAKQNFLGKRIWVHCASLGEFEQGRPLIEKIKHDYSNHSVIVTFFSSSGYEIQRDYKKADFVCYLPFDAPQSSNEFVDILNPDIAIFIKYEFWYYYLQALKKRNVPTFSVSSIFRPEQQFFRNKNSLFKKMLDCFDHFFVQNESSRKLLESIGIKEITISGDTRFDRVVEICSRPKKVDSIEEFKQDKKLMVVGSSWPQDIEVLLPLINSDLDELKFIVAPHEVEFSKIKNFIKQFSVKYQLFSKIKKKELSDARVLVIDSIGLLSSLYQYGDLAYIGGAFGDGLHNILEAATFGLPIIFGKGKDNHKYQEAMDLLEKGGAFEVRNAEELSLLVTKFLNDKTSLVETGKISKDYVVSMSGATEKIMDHLKLFLS